MDIENNTHQPQLPKSLHSFVAFIAIWFILGTVLNYFNKPEQLEPTEYFNICVIKDNKPTLIPLQKQSGLHLCQQNHNNIKTCSFCSFDITQVHEHKNKQSYDKNNDSKHTEWEITSWSDSMGDPLVYRYQVNNKKIIPLWWSYAGMMLQVSYWIYAFIASFIVLKVIKFIIAKTTKKPTHSQNRE